MKKWLLLAVKLGVSGTLIGYLLSSIDLDEALARAGGMSMTTLMLAFGLIGMQVLIAAARWKVVVHAIGARLRLSVAARITFVSLFFNQFLPASIGADLVRMWYSRRTGLPLSTAINGVMLERFGNLFCVCLMACATFPLLTLHLASTVNTAIVAILLAGGMAAAIVLMLLDHLPDSWRRWRIVRGLAYLAMDSRRLFLQMRFAWALLLFAIAGQLALAAAVFAVALGLNLNVTILDCIVLMPAVVLVSSLPISVAGWGVREMAMVTAFGTVGVPADGGLLLSLILGFTTVAVALPGGLIWLAARDPGTNENGLERSQAQ